MRSLRILYCVLNWGLGHASRSRYVIDLLLEKGLEIEIASDGISLDLLKREYPNQRFHELPGYDVEYSHSKKGFNLQMLKQTPRLKKVIQRECRFVSDQNAKSPYDLIISDGRLGCYDPEKPSVLITHQLRLPLSGLFKIAQPVYEKMLDKFDRIWVPDQNGELSGELSQARSNSIEIGWLSSYTNTHNEKDIDFLFLLSGPEPQRSLLEEALSKYAPYDKSVWMIRGSTDKGVNDQNLNVIDIADRTELNQLLNKSKCVVCRSGYSSLMDLKKLGIPAILIPTPGQKEQEYLSERLQDDPQFKVVLQHKIGEGIFNHSAVVNYPEIIVDPSRMILKELDELTMQA